MRSLEDSIKDLRDAIEAERWFSTSPDFIWNYMRLLVSEIELESNKELLAVKKQFDELLAHSKHLQHLIEEGYRT